MQNEGPRLPGKWNIGWGLRSQSALAIAASTVGARHLKSCLTSQGASLKHRPASHEAPRHPTSIIIASAYCPQAGTAVIRYSSFSTLQISFRILSAHKSSILSSAPLLTCECIDIAHHRPLTLHLGADALERSRNHLITTSTTFPNRCKAAGY